VQGLLEVIGIPYTGSSVLASALAMDKLKAKELFRLYNVPTPPYYVVERDDLGKLEEMHGSFGFPVFVKPRRSGSSVGAGRATNMVELAQRCEDAAKYDTSVLVERFVIGREVTVGVLDGRALGALEIVPRGEFYDYKSKYQKGQSDYHLPARLAPTRYKRRAQPRGARASSALGCRGFDPRRSPRDRGRERVRARGEHAAGHDAHVLAPQDRCGGGLRLRRPLRVHPRRRHPRRPHDGVPGRGRSAERDHRRADPPRGVSVALQRHDATAVRVSA
jgi:hypothetical protein